MSNRPPDAKPFDIDAMLGNRGFDTAGPSVRLTGAPKAPTPAVNDNDDTIATTRHVRDRLNMRAAVAEIVGDYNSVTGWGTDDTAAILAQLQALSASGGGALIIPYSKRPYIGTSFEMPANTAIRFEHCANGTHDGLSLGAFSGTLWVSPAATITVGNACRIEANLFRAGWQPGITAERVAATFIGTALLLKSNCANIAIKGMIVGFEYSIEPQHPDNADGSKQHNRIDISVVVDCINGPHIHNSYDIGRHNSIHCWPFTNVANTGAAADPDGAHLKRGGYSLWLSGVNDWTMVFQHFSYGYAIGCRITNCGSVTVINGAHDHVPGSADGSIGYLIEGNAREITLVAPQVAGKEFGVVINSVTPSGRLAVELVAPRLWVSKTVALDIQNGSVKITGGTIRNDPVTTPNGIGVKNRNAGSAEVTLIGVDFRGLTKAIENRASTAVLRHWLCTFTACNILISDAYMPTIASAASIAPNGVDTVFNLTGSVPVQAISSPQRYAGKMVTFICVNGLSFSTSGNIVTRTGATVAVAAGKTFTAVSDGVNWYEI
jgi:hypothetical protein